MAVQVQTNDSAALTDADLDELASMGGAFGIGELSKAKEDWVLITMARIDGKLHGFTFSTLERIGGTPCVLLGLMSVRRSSRRDQVLRGPDGRGLPPGADGVPRRGRRRRLALRLAPTRSTRSRSSTTSRRAPVSGPSARSGRGAAGSPSASTSRARTTRRRSSSAPAARRGSSTTSRPSRRRSTRRAASCSPTSPADGGGSLIVYGWTMAEDLVKLGAPALAGAPRARVRRRRPPAADDPGVRHAAGRRRAARRARRPRLAGAERRQDAGLAPRRARGRGDGAVLGHHAAADAARCVPLEAAARRAGDRHPARRPARLHRPLLRARQAGDRPRRRRRRVAGAVLDDRRLDVGDDDAARRRGARARRAVLRRVPRRAPAAPGARHPAGDAGARRDRPRLAGTSVGGSRPAAPTTPAPAVPAARRHARAARPTRSSTAALARLPS